MDALSPFFPARDPDLAALARLVGGPHIEGALGVEIDRADEMFAYLLRLSHGHEATAALLYLHQGARVAEMMETLGRAAWGEAWSRLPWLDFASGYGRAMRFLVHSKPADTIWVSDLQAPALAFQARHLAVGSLPSHVRPERFEVGARGPQRPFALIQVTSLFSHLPMRTFGAWLKALWELTADDGVLAISTLDLSLLEGTPLLGSNRSPGEGPEAGFVFQPTSESQALDPTSYGTTYLDEACFRDLVDRHLGLPPLGARRPVGQEVRVERVAHGVCGHQDLYLLGRRADLASLAAAVPRFPRGEIDRVEQVSPEEVELSGWAASPGAVREVEVGEVAVGKVAVGGVEVGGVDAVRLVSSRGSEAVHATLDPPDASGRRRFCLRAEIGALGGVDALLMAVAASSTTSGPGHGRPATGGEDENGSEERTSVIGAGTLRPFLVS